MAKPWNTPEVCENLHRFLNVNLSISEEDRRGKSDVMGGEIRDDRGDHQTEAPQDQSVSEERGTVISIAIHHALGVEIHTLRLTHASNCNKSMLQYLQNLFQPCRR